MKKKKLVRALVESQRRLDALRHPPVYRVAAMADSDRDDARIEKVVIERDGHDECRVERIDDRHWVVYLIDEFGNEKPVHARLMPAFPYPDIIVE